MADAASRSLERFIAALANLDGSASFTAIAGTVLVMQPDCEPRELLGCVGARVASASAAPTGDWQVSAREVLLYTDASTGEVLDRWPNPISHETVDVVHDWLDPAGRMVRPGSVSMHAAPRGVVFRSMWSDTSTHPLRPDVFSRENSAALLQRAEHEVVEAADAGTTTASTVRFTPWLPWMLLAGTEGSLVFHMHHVRVPSFAELDARVRQRITNERPEFAFAPTTWNGRRENSWSTYAAERQPAR